MSVRLFIAAVLFAISVSSFGQSERIKGTITDKKTGETLVGATVMIDGTTKGTITDFDGNYVIDNLEPGIYSITISYVSYNTIQKSGLVVTVGEETTYDTIMEEATTDLAEVKVVGKANRETEAVLLMEQKKAVVIKESIGVEQMSNMGVSNAAAATTKISGVTKTEGTGDIFVRGLGDRYISTTMNNLPIPSDNVDKKNIDLNLFSTDVISNVGISKTYDVSTYGDQTSGNINIVSKRMAKNNSVELATGLNYNIISENVFGDFKATQNMEDVTLGFYQHPYKTTAEALTKQSWNTTNRNTPIDYEVSLIGGKNYNFSNNHKLYVFGTLSHSGNSAFQEGTYKKYRSNSLYASFSQTEEYITDICSSGLLNISYDFNSKHSVSYNGLYIRKTTDELYEAGRNLEGFIFEELPKETELFVSDQNIKETVLFINQVYGSHGLGDRNKLNWAMGYNIVDADEPNRIRNVVAIYPDHVSFTFAGGDSQRKSYQKISDRELNGFLQNELSLINGDINKLKATFGVNFRYKTRDFSSQVVSTISSSEDAWFASIDNMDETLLNNNSLPINELLPDLYTSELLIAAGFLNVNFVYSKLHANAGLRYDNTNMFVDWDVANYLGRKDSRDNTYNNLFPSLNLNYQVNEKNNLRLALSKTITLPEFKELAPFEYVSPSGDISKGNPDLKNSTNYNADLKWEMFPSPRELISLATFYKKINDPINLTLSRGSSGYFYFDNTGNEANVYGIELETRINITRTVETNKPKIHLSANATKMWLKQDLLEVFQYNGKTESGLQGASDFIANVSLTFSTNTENELKATLTGNYSSDKIYALGAPETQGDKHILFNNEIIEKGFIALDMVLSKKLNNRFTIKLKGKNLLNPEIERVQSVKETLVKTLDTTVRSYKNGIYLSIGLNMDLNK
ncbi:MAG: TonB-dependent receptor [Candidatus Delongbacteria bacterium]|nr:TonB-dependent receptor [Candidatus Delongbacteria bacterium]MBN2821083.1 TonB-dependent receptor [Bacteroidales bacterium]